PREVHRLRRRVRSRLKNRLEIGDRSVNPYRWPAGAPAKGGHMPRKVRRALARVAKRLLTKMTIFCFALGALLVVGAAMWLGSMLGIAGFGSAISATLALAAIALAF